MPRGRKPDGPELQAAKGNPGRRKVGKVKVGKPGEIVRPTWLGKSRRALEVWNTLVPILTRLNLATELDANPLARYCRYVVEWIAADEAIRKEGTWYNGKDTNGEAKKFLHPAYRAWRELEKMLSDTESAFGMNAASRFKILRDQAAALGGLPLFDNAGGQAERRDEPPADAADADDDPVGALSRMDAPPPGSRPN